MVIDTVDASFPMTLSTLERAIVFATERHHDQVDRSGAPYILHPLRVMLSLETEAEKVTALLHDLVEDTDVTITEIEKEFGKEIADAVASVTRIEHPEKERYFDFVKRSKLHPIGRKVKIADVKDNLSPTRMAALSEEEREGMTKRYTKALHILEDF